MDRYTKIVLTVIAVSLVVIAARPLVPSAAGEGAGIPGAPRWLAGRRCSLRGVAPAGPPSPKGGWLRTAESWAARSPRPFARAATTARHQVARLGPPPLHPRRSGGAVLPQITGAIQKKLAVAI